MYFIVLCRIKSREARHHESSHSMCVKTRSQIPVDAEPIASARSQPAPKALSRYPVEPPVLWTQSDQLSK